MRFICRIAAGGGVLVIVFCAGILVGYQARNRKSHNWRFHADVVHVVDGDTVDVAWFLGTNRVRVVGIECPEVRRGDKLQQQAETVGCGPERLLAFGKDVANEAKRQLLDKEVVIYFPNRRIERGAFGRLIAYIYVDGSDYGENLARGGMAWAREEPHPKSRQYTLHTDAAKTRGLGVFGLGE